MSFLIGLIVGMILGALLMSHYARLFYEEAALWRRKFFELRDKE